jgi:hypothetical protein
MINSLINRLKLILIILTLLICGAGAFAWKRAALPAASSAPHPEVVPKVPLSGKEFIYTGQKLQAVEEF